MIFIDQATIYVKAGDGGHGCIAFLREKHRPRGGPSGGDGGNGGNVILKVNPQLSTLHDITYKRHYRAGRGGHGSGNNRHGKNGEDVQIQVPPGTVVKDSETKQVICDLTELDESIIIARGGNGGFGNARFKTQTNTAPRIANDGQPGEEKTIEFELKVLADVGLVGFPNAGKSTFLSSVSAAKPKIADYPFTTLTPNLGIIKYGDFTSFVMADIPGLIEGASDGKGLGNQFLRHIERTRVLVFLIDGGEENIMNQYRLLRAELEQKNPDLNSRPSMILLTKQDAWINEPDIDVSKLGGIPVIQISSVTGYGIQNAIKKIVSLIDSISNDSQKPNN